MAVPAPVARLAHLSGAPLAVLVVGPTASGKSALAVALAEAFEGEVMNCDSRQLYRRMAIGTAKPSASERRGIAHHLFDLAEPERGFSAAMFVAAARECALGIVSRGRLPVLCGGTGLYLRALLDGLFEGPDRDPSNHARLDAIASKGGLPRLRRWLERVDPRWAAQIGTRDRQRILRGLDVWLQSGLPISQHIERQLPSRFPFATLKLAIDWPREELYRRIDRRVRGMIESGWIDELKSLLELPEIRQSNAVKAVGYRDLLSHLEGRLGLEEAIASIQRDTRRLAKRQLTWFRRDPEIHWIPAADGNGYVSAAVEIVRSRILGIPNSTASCAKREAT